MIEGLDHLINNRGYGDVIDAVEIVNEMSIRKAGGTRENAGFFSLGSTYQDACRAIHDDLEAGLAIRESATADSKMIAIGMRPGNAFKSLRATERATTGQTKQGQTKST